MIVLRRILTCAAAALALLVITGCAPHDAPASTATPGIPDGVEIDPLGNAPAGAWVERGESFAVVTMGSSSCPPVVTDVRAKAGDHVVVTFGPSPNDPCTADMAPTTHQLDLPEGVTGSPVTVEIEYEDWPETQSVTLE
jgi:hypothetical protein